MSLRSYPKTRGLLTVTVSALCLVGIAGKAEAKARTIKAPLVEQQAPVSDPLAYPNAPLRAGALTLDDVLEAHRNRTKSAKPPPAETQTPSATATAPVLSPSSGSSTTGLMVSQGMKAVLQKLGPAAPQTPPLSAAPTLTALKVPVLQQPSAPAPTLASGAKYQPGQEPRNLATGKPSPSVDSHVSLTALPPSSAKEKSVLALPCKPRVDKWEKNCAEAGYPASFVGKILGETRIDCKTDDQLHDFWVSNTCAPPSSANEDGEPKVAVKEEERTPLPEPQDEIIEGVCGKADGESFAAAPTRDLCDSGTASDIEGNGPWTWSCNGSRKALTERCAASVEKETEEKPAPVPVAERAPQPVPADEPEPELQPAPPPPSPRVEPLAPKRAGRAPLPSADDDIVMSPELVAELTGGVTIAEDSLPASERQASSSARAGGKTSSASKPEGQAETPKASPPRPERKPEPAAPKSLAKPEAKQAAVEAKPESKAASSAEPQYESQAESKPEPTPATPRPIPVNEDLCGVAAETLAGEAPTKNLCRAGSASPVNGEGPWTWSCTNNEGVVSTCRTLSLKKPAAAVSPPRPSPESAMVKAAPRVKVEEAKPLKPVHEPAKDKPLSSDKNANEAKTETPAVAKTGHFLPEKPPEAPKASNVRLSLDPAMSSISFVKGTDTIDKEALTKLSKLAATLKENPDVRIYLISHADSAGSSPREAHRLSLNRALNVRGYLTSHGVAQSRMDVSAKGSDGAEGNKDRVDIQVYE